ncbi:hypothetical protein DAPPUDRAFT_101866 [Daphnia pulex]|uniref:Uncharacterized protein n=1 Tax=Daphnia pulex TaxID=6669 RepID=E9GES5_DAPPU|nr:hypothetical protein DAPPUDRAFT_101866 [Daphnia pulex]|eukprot:EFX82029.1 hypothetical protein DAPPUDRAFT_101866 [Daphnia pulex]
MSTAREICIKGKRKGDRSQSSEHLRPVNNYPKYYSKAPKYYNTKAPDYYTTIYAAPTCDTEAPAYYLTKAVEHSGSQVRWKSVHLFFEQDEFYCKICNPFKIAAALQSYVDNTSLNLTLLVGKPNFMMAVPSPTTSALLPQVEAEDVYVLPKANVEGVRLEDNKVALTLDDGQKIPNLVVIESMLSFKHDQTSGW